MPRPPDLAGNKYSCLSFLVIDSSIIEGRKLYEGNNYTYFVHQSRKQHMQLAVVISQN